MWQFLITLIDKELYGLVLFIAILITVLGLAVVFALYKLISLLLHKKPKVKYKGAELGFEDEKDNSEEASGSVVPSNLLKTKYIIHTIVTESVDTGYQNCRKRQELFDSQMHNLRDQLNLLHVSILRDYDEKQPGTTHDLASMALKASFEKSIANPLRDTFVADKLAELSQDDLIEKHRPLIETAFSEVKQDIVKGLQNDSLKSIKTSLVEALDVYEKDFRKIIVEILTFAWKEAKKFLDEVGLQNDLLTSKINRLLEGFIDVDQELPESWISSESATPPADIVGGSK